MHWEAIGAVAELLAALGVIVSLFYLAMQIRQSSKLTRIALLESYVTGSRATFDQILENPDLYRVWRLGFDSPDEMSEEDRERYGMILYATFNQFYLGYERSKLDPRMARQYLVWLDRFADNRAVNEWWSRQRPYFDPEFAQVVDERFRSTQPRQSTTAAGGAAERDVAS